MENENIENEVIENDVFENEPIENEIIEDVSENTNLEDVSINDVSEIEDVPEKIILDDSDVENIEEEPSYGLEQLLRNYFSTNSELRTGEVTENVEGDLVDSTVQDETVLDYTSLLNDILSNTADSKQLISDTYDNIVQIEENNLFSSSIEDISLTNQLLIVLIIVLLFNGLVDFARRIF